jgi:hypothetical protein
MAGSVAASDESILSALPGDVRWPHGAAAIRSHDARISEILFCAGSFRKNRTKRNATRQLRAERGEARSRVRQKE